MILVAVHKRMRDSVKDVPLEKVPVDVVGHRLFERECIRDGCRTMVQEISKEVRKTLQIISVQVRICL